MSLSDLAAVGSLISGIAVFLSFIFLSLQLRQANRNQRQLGPSVDYFDWEGVCKAQQWSFDRVKNAISRR